MQLKLRRSQREGGIAGKTVIFCLDARAELTPEERASLSRYKLYSQVIYNSQAAREHLEKSKAATDAGGALGIVKGFAHLAMTALNLNITIKSLEQGQHIECKSMDELLAAEDALMSACENLRLYLETAATFDGREMVIDFSSGAPAVLAMATTPEPRLIAPTPTPALAPTVLEERQQHAGESHVGTEYVASSPALFQYDWNNKQHRRWTIYAIGLLLLIVLLRSCL